MDKQSAKPIHSVRMFFAQLDLHRGKYLKKINEPPQICESFINHSYCLRKILRILLVIVNINCMINIIYDRVLNHQFE